MARENCEGCIDKKITGEVFDGHRFRALPNRVLLRLPGLCEGLTAVLPPGNDPAND